MGECCTNQKCCCSCHSQEMDQHDEHKQKELSHYFLELADAAWEEVLKEKIKEYLLSTQNERMTELAKIVAEANNQRWRHKMEKKQVCMELKEKLGRFFGQSKK